MNLLIEKEDQNGTTVKGAMLTLRGKDKDGKAITFIAGTLVPDNADIILINGSGEALVWYSGSTACQLIGLPGGTYTLHEELAPDGYQKAKDLTFEIKDGRLYAIDGKTAEGTDKIVMIDEKTVVTTTTAAITTAATTKATTTTAKATTTTAKATTTTSTETTTVPTETTPIVTTSAPAEVLRGDVNLDNEITVEDAQIALISYTEKFAGNEIDLTEDQLKAADVNGDGNLTVEDAQYILIYYTERTVAGKETTWEDLIGEPSPKKALPARSKLKLTAQAARLKQ